MKPQLHGLHHVTATVSEAQPDIDFYVGLLGLRLVKTTVNFDNPAVYHLYYGDERGSPSTLMTTFPYGGWSVPPGVRGAGQIHVTSFSVPSGSLSFWKARLENRGILITERASRFGAESLTVSDPSGLHIELIEVDEDPRTPWLAEGIEPGVAIRGVHGVTLLLHDTGPSLDFLANGLGFEVVATDGPRTRTTVGPGGPGAFVELLRSPDAPHAVNGLGTVHHVAFAVDDAEEQLRVRRLLVESGQMVTEVRDRQYFQSIYFREPGGVLYEIATLGPGFAIDEEVAELGEALRLPAWEEPNRVEIESRLAPISRP